MATVNKDFKIKSGLVVEGTTGTINGYDILTESQASVDFIVSTIGGTATAANTPNTVVKRNGDGDFAAGVITADLVGDVTGDVTGTVSDISNHNTDSLSEGQNNLYFETYRATDAVAAELGTGIVYGSQGAGNVFHVDEMLIATRTYADDAAGTAQENAESYADTVSGNALTSAQAYADTAESDAVTTANAYTDGRETAITTAYQSYADTAEQDAKDYADDLINDASSSSTEVWSAYKTSTEIGLAQAAAELHADNAIAALVDSAPATLDTLNELAAALQDNPDIIGDLQDIAAGKQDTLTPGANIDITGATISVTGLSTDDVAEDAGNLYFTNQRALDATAAAYDVVGSGAGALEQANDYTDGEITTALTTAQGYADDAEADAISAAAADATTKADAARDAAIAHADALTTDDVEEGEVNEYFTDSRAKASAASLLTGASLTNITITGTGAGLTITAENGVADSTTSDLAEGTNLYFTDARARTAVDGTDRSFTSVELNSVAKQVAATLSAPTAGIQVAHAFAKADYRSAEYLVKVAYGDHTEISKVLLTLDVNDNIAITEYGIVGTNGSASSISAGISGANVQLQVTTANNDSTVTVMGTLLV
jgi:hypothetical protein